MARKLGEILVEGSLVSPSDLKKALDAQLIFGGRLGTNLLDLGYLDEETLTRVLREQKRIEVATPRMLEQATGEALRLVPARVADRHKVIPLAIEERKLKVAMLDPNDLIALDELAFVTGHSIIPYLAPEVRLLAFLERYYDIPRPLRYIRLSTSDADEDAVAGSVAVTRDPAAPASDRIVAPLPENWRQRPQEGEHIAPASEAMLSIEELLGVAPGGSISPKDLARDAPPESAERVERVVEQLKRQSQRTEVVRGPLTSDQLRTRLAECESRDDIGEALVDFGTGLFDRVIAWVIQKDRALGWLAAVPGRNRDAARQAVRHIAVDLAEPSVLMDVVTSGRYYMGELTARRGDEFLAHVLGPPRPSVIVIVPVLLGEQSVLALQGDRSTGGPALTSADLKALRQAAQKAGLAMEVLLLRSRIRQAE